MDGYDGVEIDKPFNNCFMDQVCEGHISQLKQVDGMLVY
jgi:hypothetical protein